MCLQTKVDLMLLAELPVEVKLRIFHEFLYQDFFHGFQRLFKFEVERANKGPKFLVNEKRRMGIQQQFIEHEKLRDLMKISKFPYYTLKDLDY